MHDLLGEVLNFFYFILNVGGLVNDEVDDCEYSCSIGYVLHWVLEGTKHDYEKHDGDHQYEKGKKEYFKVVN